MLSVPPKPVTYPVQSISPQRFLCVSLQLLPNSKSSLDQSPPRSHDFELLRLLLHYQFHQLLQAACQTYPLVRSQHKEFQLMYIPETLTRHKIHKFDEKLPMYVIKTPTPCDVCWFGVPNGDYLYSSANRAPRLEQILISRKLS